MSDRPTSPPMPAWALVAALVGIAPIAPAASAQSLRDSVVAPAAPPGYFDGRTFSGVDLPATVQDFALSVSAARAWTWRETNTERLLLDRDVRVTIGPYSFRAKKASIWLEPIRISGQDAEQIAVYFERALDPGGPAGFSQQGERLLVTAIISRTEPSLKADLLREGRPDDPFVVESEGRLSRYLTELVEGPPAGSDPSFSRRGAGQGGRGMRGDELPAWASTDDRGAMPPAERSAPVYADAGLVTFYADTIEIVDSPTEKSVMLTGGVSVQYAQAAAFRGGPTVQLSASRAVVFLTPDADARQSGFDKAQVKGVYLEGDVVATTGQYTLRGKRVFYDIATDRAVVLDAVFWTYDEERGMPLYLRADMIRQESQNQWTARDVRLANVGFAEPHFSIGATSVTLTRAPRADGPQTGERGTRTLLDAQGVTFRFGETPVAYIPGLKGEVRPSILKGLSVGSEQGDAVVKTSWDLYAITGIDAAAGNEATLLLDGYFNRGPAGGLDLTWNRPDLRGSFFGYTIYDDGTDLLPSGDEIKQDDEVRGLVTAEQVWRLSDNWTLFLEGAWISDETFVPAFFRTEAETRREYINSAYLRYLAENTGFEIEARGTFNDFVTNQYLLQSLGYTTEKLPEAAYHRVGDDLFDGLLSYTSDYRLSAMQLEFTEPRIRDLGFSRIQSARAAFGLTPDDSLADQLRASGLHEDPTYRADTRQEFEMPLRAGPVNIVPFVVGRATAWDDNFDEFNQQPENDPYRLWGAAGIRFATTLQRVDDSVDSRALDLHRMRHLVEPSATVWSAGSDISQNDLPIYDDEVESIASGTAARVGLRNTWQTQRGGEGNWQSVDWLTIDTNYIWSSTDVDVESPYGRFIEAQPEQSNLGEFLSNEAVLALTDALSITNGILYDVENNSLARTTVGAILDHGYGFSSFGEFRYLDVPQSTFVDLGARYEFTRKYAATIAGTIDAEEGDFQEISTRIERRFPQWTVDLRLGYDNITEEFSAGLALRPVGLGAERRTRVFTRDLTDRPATNLATPPRDRLEWGPFR